MPLSPRRSPGRRLLAAVLPAVLLTSGTFGISGLLASPAAAAPVTALPGPGAKIDAKLAERMKSATGRLEAVVVLRSVQDAPPTDSPAQARKALTASAEPVQDPVAEFVRSRGDQVVNTFWLKNMVLVRATPATLTALAGLDLVDRVIPNFTLTAPEPKQARAAKKAAAGATTWGVAKIGADRVQGEGLTGKGVRVAVLDTGIDITHPDLQGKLVTDDAADPKHPGGWIEFDADGKPVATEPHDSAFHGTHVSGTIAGGNASGTQIGVAPGAELMAAEVIPGGSGTLAQVIAGMQWALAPYDAEGKPAGQPADVVSMSLGAEGYSDEFIEPVRNIYRAGAFPSFAIGNDCVEGQSASPGNVYESVSVGATDVNDEVPGFSCGGVVKHTDWFAAPPEWPESYVVPDVSAPGVDVMSAMPGGQYGNLDGTSMATPHVSGTVALMLQARPDLTVDETEEILSGTSVSDDRYGPLPNPRYGHGRIDAYAAVSEAALTSGVRGTVTDERGGSPLTGVSVVRSDGRATQTDANGRFELRLPPGEHELTLSRFGYETRTVTVRVKADRVSDTRLELERTRWGTISGQVAYGPTGSTVPGATVTVLGVPDKLTGTTGADGRYTIEDVPEGDYQISANAPGVSRSDPLAVTVGRHQARADVTLPRRSPTERASLGTDGRQGNHEAWWPELSGDGSVVVYAAFASNLADDQDTNGELDVFATDVRTRATERVSVPSGGGLADSFSLSPTVSRDGRYVGFNSGATNLVPGDTNGVSDAFLHDRQTGTTEMISVSSDGTPGDGLSGAPRFSADGRYAIFDSMAANLVPGDTNERNDVFLHDRQSGTTERVSVTQDGAQVNGNAREATISADGRYVAFQSDAADLVPGDDNGRIDTFVLDRQAGTLKRVTGPFPDTDTTGPVISADGTALAYSNGAGLGEIYVHDLATGKAEMVSVTVDGKGSNGLTFGPALTADGGKVTFATDAGTLVAGDANGQGDVFVRDVKAGTTTRISGALQGAEGDGRSDLPSISEDGRYVAFESTSANLVEGDTNRRSDVFVHDLVAGPEAVFAVAGLEISPPVSRSGRVRVQATVKNVGERKGSYEAVLRVNGEEEQRRSVSLAPGRSTRVSFDLRRGTAGDYTVVLGPLTGEFTVKH